MDRFGTSLNQPAISPHERRHDFESTKLHVATKGHNKTLPN